jgi:cytochrome c biogenesis protein CcdA
MLCIHRDFSKSWMGSKGVLQESYYDQYVTSFYFVTTTISTAGFGDISATSKDNVECFAFSILIFIGLLFYSYAVQNFQALIVEENVNSENYAFHMRELIENIIVKLGRTNE